jgi:cell division protein FtsZ
MALSITVPQERYELKPRITVVGAGGAGGNAVSNMIRCSLEGVEFIVANTDAQALSQSLCQNRIQLGSGITRGLGAGARPEIGRASAEESIDEIMQYLHGSHMVFVTAGMGGGTGTGAAAVIARAAREAGMLSVAVVTKPFHFEGAHRMRLAEAGIEELAQVVDTLIIIPNQNLFRLANEKTTFADAFRMADDVLYSGVRGITDLMVMPGIINLDFADIRTVMSEMGKAMMGTGEASGDGRAIAAAEAAVSNPLLDDVSMSGARAVLVNVTGGMDMTLYEIDEAVNKIRAEVDENANIIFGSTLDEKMTGSIRISLVATGIDGQFYHKNNSDNLFLHQPSQTYSQVAASRPKQSSQPHTGYSVPRSNRATVASVSQPVFVEQPEEQSHSTAAFAVSSHPAAQPSMNTTKPVYTPPAQQQQSQPQPLGTAPAAPSTQNAPSRPNSGGFFSRFHREQPKENPQPAAIITRDTNNYQNQQAAAKQRDDQNLDIPAFLRRQAN